MRLFKDLGLQRMHGVKTLISILIYFDNLTHLLYQE